MKKYNFLKKLYNSPSVEPIWKYYKWRLEKGINNADVYVLVLNEGSDMLDIVKSDTLANTRGSSVPTVVGFAKEYEEALCVAAALCQAALEQTGSPDIKRYIG